jgi:hypothetical protein
MIMRKEDTLVFLFSRVHLNEAEVSSMEALLKAPLDWDYIFEKSQKEGISSLAYYHLYNFQTKGLVIQHLTQLKDLYYRNSLNNIMILEEVKKVLRTCNEEKIKAIVLKGAFLAENIYKNSAFRTMSDIDILIKKEDLSGVNKILNSLGFLSSANFQDALRNALPSSLNSLVYRRKSGGKFFVHLHWHLINTTWPLDSLVNKIDMKRIWSCAQATRIGGIDALTLAPHHLLLYLAQHSFNHSFDRLILLSDIIETVRYYKEILNWDLVVEEAERFNVSAVLYYSLSFTSHVLRFEIPELERLKPPKFGFLEETFSFFMRKGMRGYWLSYFAYLFMEKGVFRKLRFFGRTLFPPPYVMGHYFMLPSSQVRISHYCQRIVNTIF